MNEWFYKDLRGSAFLKCLNTVLHYGEELILNGEYKLLFAAKQRGLDGLEKGWQELPAAQLSKSQVLHPGVTNQFISTEEQKKKKT